MASSSPASGQQLHAAASVGAAEDGPSVADTIPLICMTPPSSSCSSAPSAQLRTGDQIKVEHKVGATNKAFEDYTYDVFLAYSPMYTEAAQRIYSLLKDLFVGSEGRRLRVFFNQEAPAPHNIRVCHALCNSVVVMPLISPRTFETGDCTVLVEHAVALELLEWGRVRTIVPVFIGPCSNANVPEDVAQSVGKTALQWLRNEGLPSMPKDEPESNPLQRHGRVVQQTCGAICRFQGCTVTTGGSLTSWMSAASLVRDVVQEVSAWLELERQRLACAQAVSLRCNLDPSPDNALSPSSVPLGPHPGASSPPLGPDSGEHLWVGFSASDHEHFQQEMQDWVTDFRQGRPDSKWTLCHLLLADFMVDRETRFADGALPLWEQVCQRASATQDSMVLITEFDSFVRNRKIQSPKLVHWGCIPMDDAPNSEFPRASFEVITQLVSKHLTRVQLVMWQGFAERWRLAAAGGPTNADCKQLLSKAERILETVLRSQNIHVLGSILSIRGYVLFLRVPSLLGIVAWQWLLQRRFTGLPELALHILASSQGTFLPELHQWNNDMKVDLPAALKLIASMPSNVLDAESWPLSWGALFARSPGVLCTRGAFFHVFSCCRV